MWSYPKIFDCLIIGAGHAGCEAAFCCARMGASTLLLTMNLDTIAKMSCNPAIGGTAKGHLVREIDALGGIMGKVADRTAIHYRMLNKSKGPAVWSPRCQSDRAEYALEMKLALENVEGLEIKHGTIDRLIVENGRVCGVETAEGIRFDARTVIISAGTFMRGLMHVGKDTMPGGRSGDKASIGLSKCLEDLGLRLGRLKTGTPPRVNSRTIDFSVCEEQPSENNVRFSHDAHEKSLSQISCWITHTTAKTKDLVLDNVLLSPMYSGKIDSVGPRYCPAIEDKFMRFQDKERHQVYLEPEGLKTNEVYVNGISTSLPFDVQLEMVRSVTGLEKAEIMRPGYAIEYDYVLCGQIDLSMKAKEIEGLYLAGQINGTTGYEEAAAQGMMAAINAVRSLKDEEPLVIRRSEGYIGVLIDDLVTKDHTEPYRLFTSRAEHRLLLRQDNADLRLREIGRSVGLIDDETYGRFVEKRAAVERSVTKLRSKQVWTESGKQVSLAQLMCRPEVNYQTLESEYSLERLDADAAFQVEVMLKYAGYIQRQEKEALKLEILDKLLIPKGFDFQVVKGLRNEAREKLSRFSPNNLGQASRISGVSPADITVLMVALKR
jgi:tRNA uridine 5-carboxymethylaminomethyl modification enzyme